MLLNTKRGKRPWVPRIKATTVPVVSSRGRVATRRRAAATVRRATRRRASGGTASTVSSSPGVGAYTSVVVATAISLAVARTVPSEALGASGAASGRAARDVAVIVAATQEAAGAVSQGRTSGSISGRRGSSSRGAVIKRTIRLSSAVSSDLSVIVSAVKQLALRHAVM
jgi:hypothetical protein